MPSSGPLECYALARLSPRNLPGGAVGPSQSSGPNRFQYPAKVMKSRPATATAV
jgi:hypothetical protein